MFIDVLRTDPVFYITWVVVVAFSVCMHEAAHAWVAATQGDTTAWRAGYLTLNPLKVMGVGSLVMLALVGIAWGAVPVNPRTMRRRYSPALVACAGPGANLALAITFAFLAAVVQKFGTPEIRQTSAVLLTTGIGANCFLLIFNMLPFPVFDGWALYSWLLPQLRRVGAQAGNRASLIAILVIFITPIGGWLWQLAFRLRGAVAGTMLLLLDVQP